MSATDPVHVDGVGLPEEGVGAGGVGVGPAESPAIFSDINENKQKTTNEKTRKQKVKQISNKSNCCSYILSTTNL